MYIVNFLIIVREYKGGRVFDLGCLYSKIEVIREGEGGERGKGGGFETGFLAGRNL